MVIVKERRTTKPQNPGADCAPDTHGVSVIDNPHKDIYKSKSNLNATGIQAAGGDSTDVPLIFQAKRTGRVKRSRKALLEKVSGTDERGSVYIKDAPKNFAEPSLRVAEKPLKKNNKKIKMNPDIKTAGDEITKLYEIVEAIGIREVARALVSRSPEDCEVIAEIATLAAASLTQREAVHPASSEVPESRPAKAIKASRVKLPKALPELPTGLRWPEDFGLSPYFNKKNGIIRYLETSWRPLITAGIANMPLLREHYKTAAKAIDNYQHNGGRRRELPSHVKIPTLSDLIDQELATTGVETMVTTGLEAMVKVSPRLAATIAARVRRGQNII